MKLHLRVIDRKSPLCNMSFTMLKGVFKAYAKSEGPDQTTHAQSDQGRSPLKESVNTEDF